MFTNFPITLSDCIVLARALGEEAHDQGDSKVMGTETEKVGKNCTSVSDVLQHPKM